ncbi:MAG: ATP-dependent helicase, partial [Actinobacteria bacterium]|nr:ATP-dependent helicase [Actinomycetota bacterium]
VFCRTRSEVDDLAESLNGRGYRAEALHGGMDQEQRDRVMGRVRNGAANLLIATDVAARGLDIDHLTHVFNFDVPVQPEQYVHRIGRVGRAGREGAAVTISTPNDQRLIRNIERVTKQHMSVGQIPTVAQLRARRRELTIDSVRTVLEAQDLGEYRTVAEALVNDYDPIDIMAAAIKAAHEAVGASLPENEQEINNVELRGERRRNEGDRFRKGGERTLRGPGEGRGFDRGDRSDRPERPVQAGYSRLYVSAGRRNGVRPQDLVGAICGETSLNGRQIGAIRITENFSLVEVPAANAEEVIRKLGGTTLKGRKPTVRRDKAGS